MVVINPCPHQKAFFFTRKGCRIMSGFTGFVLTKEQTIRVEKICSFENARIRLDGTLSKDGKFEAQ